MRCSKTLLGVLTFLVTFSTTTFLSQLIFDRFVSPPSATRHTPPPFNISKDLNADITLVALDREHKRSYTRLTLSLDYPRPLSERFWVRTYFFTPDDPSHRTWASAPVEIQQPFANGNYPIITVAAPCDWLSDNDAPQSGYFARVQFFTGNGETPLPSGEQFFDITTATPVVVEHEPRTIHY